MDRLAPDGTREARRVLPNRSCGYCDISGLFTWRSGWEACTLVPKPLPAVVKRLTERRVVTIAAGFKCRDGVVICADSQETALDGGYKRKVVKIEIRPQAPPEDAAAPVAIFTGAGDSVFIDEVVHEMWSAVERCGAKQINEIIGIMHDANRAYHDKIWRVYPCLHSTRELPDCHLLFAVWAKDGFELQEAHSMKFRSVKDFATIGCGDSLAYYICDDAHRSISSIARASILALYMLEKVKNHVPDCGGDSHVAVLTHTGSADMLDNIKTEHLSRQLSLTEGLLRNILVTSADLRIGDEDVKSSLRYTEDQIISLRNQSRQEIENINRIFQKMIEGIHRNRTGDPT